MDKVSMIEKSDKQTKTPRTAVGSHSAQVISLAFYREYKRAKCPLVKQRFYKGMWL